jgi:hypothetical protein
MPVIDLLAVFECEHISQESTYDEEIIKYILKAKCYYISTIQRRKYGEALKRLTEKKRWGGHLARLVREGKELNPSGRWRKWAEEIWRGGFHKEEYADLYAGILSRFEDCSADCAILCTAEASEEQFEELLRELGGVLRGKPVQEAAGSSNKVLLRKP